MTTIGISDGRPKEPRRLRELAAWYREFAEGAGNPVIWEARLRTAAELEREADQLEDELTRNARPGYREICKQPGEAAKSYTEQLAESETCCQFSLAQRTGKFFP